jgi:hypothetical protein
MKLLKLFLILSLTLLFISRVFGQAQIDIPLLVTDGSYTISMAVGLDLTATNCIDPQLGESDLPTIPPCACFEARFDLQPYGCGPVSSYKDYRPPGNPPAFPFTGMVQHTLWWQTSAQALPIDITYNLPLGVLMFITDQIGGSFLNLGPFTGQGIATIPGSYTAIFVKAFLKMQYDNIGGDPGGPIFVLSTSSLNFPQVPIGYDTSLTVTVTNYGLTNTLIISNIVSSNSYFTISPNTFPINVDPMASQNFLVTNTAAATSQQGTIQFTHNAYGSPTNLNVSAPPGFQPGPAIEISNNSFIFHQLPIGTIDSLALTIYNRGYLNTLYINNITSSNPYFGIFPNTVPIAIEPLSSQDFYVTYISADTLQQGTIQLTHNALGSPTIINVSSVYTQALCSVYPSSLLFGSQSGTRLMTITNTGYFDPLIISDIVSSNSNYTMSPNTFPISIPAGSLVLFYVTLNNASGFQFGVLDFYNNAPGSPHSILVSNQLFIPQIEGMLVVQSGPMNQVLKFGLDSLATDGIDQILGEQDIPPIPPLGVFDARFVLPENDFFGSLNSWSDYRHGFNPFVWHKEFRLSYQKNYNNGIEIGWNLPPNITGVLQDVINGTYINVPIADTGSFIVQDPLTFSKLKMLIDFNDATPVELFSFNATVLDNNVQLKWTTTTETNNSGFKIERKKLEVGSQELEWAEIGFAPGFGTTTEQKSYSFIDENITTGAYKYRLKQIDFNGSFIYSNEIEVDFTPKEFVLYQNYPNPFNPSTLIEFSLPENVSNVKLTIYSILGEKIAELVNTSLVAGRYSYTWNASNVTTGMYIYELKTDKSISVKKLLLLK